MQKTTSQFFFFAILCALCAFASNPANATSAGKKPVFEKDVLPIFTKYCFNCHGKSSPQLGLDLRSARLVMRGSQNGRVVVPGSLEKSLLWKKVSTREMPLKQFKLKLTKTEIDLIRRWILAGAPSSKTKKLPPAVRAQFAYYETKVKPILKRRCVSCHGADEPEGGLDLRSLESLLRGGKHGPVIVEGFSDKSVLIRNVAAKKMPPPDSGKPLTAAEIRTITRWIDKGKFADYVDVDRKDAEAEQVKVTEKDRKFWAFQKPVAKTPPRVKATHRVRTPIDRFVLARLEANGLTFSPDASKRTLLRRAYFDLTGLPPTPAAAREFLADDRPDAWERLIDRLLASPQYGERWGRHWLDVVGYVDTSGKDFNPNSASLSPGYWRYRDYVIAATNDDKPWNRFLTEQIAGDELVDWRKAKTFTPRIRELLTATGFLRNVLDATNEDISNLPFDRYEALFKLMERVSSSTLGMTLACARCHSHKFDPIPQTDYYRFLSLFTAAYNPNKWLPPKRRFLYDISPAEQQSLDAAKADLAKRKQQLQKIEQRYRKQLTAKKLSRIPAAIRSTVSKAIETPVQKRNARPVEKVQADSRRDAGRSAENDEQRRPQDRGRAEATDDGFAKNDLLLRAQQAASAVGRRRGADDTPATTRRRRLRRPESEAGIPDGAESTRPLANSAVEKRRG